MQIVKLADYSTHLVTRDLAEKIYNQLNFEDLPIIFDFKWVEKITTNFADQLFAKILENKGKVFKIKNVENKFFKYIISQAINTRQKYTIDFKSKFMSNAKTF